MHCDCHEESKATEHAHIAAGKLLTSYIDWDRSDVINARRPYNIKDFLSSSLIDEEDSKPKSFITSDVDSQLLLKLSFTCTVKIKSICLLLCNDGMEPTDLEAWVNPPRVDFDTLENRKKTQSWPVICNRGDIFYLTKPMFFSSVNNLALLITGHGSVVTLRKILLYGDFNTTRIETINVSYELKPNVADHPKIESSLQAKY